MIFDDSASSNRKENKLSYDETLAEEDVIFGSKIMYYVVIYDISGVSDAKYESLIPIKYLGDCVNDFYIMVLLTHYQKNRLKN